MDGHKKWSSISSDVEKEHLHPLWKLYLSRRMLSLLKIDVSHVSTSLRLLKPVIEKHFSFLYETFEECFWQRLAESY